MTESFSDLWASANPIKSQQPQLKVLGSAVNNTTSNVIRHTTPDAFSMLASAGSSQPNSRPITPSAIRPQRQPVSSKSTTLHTGDAFGGLVSFTGSTSRNGDLTIADRALRVEQERKKILEREQASFNSQDSFWDQYEGAQALDPSKPTPIKSNGGWDLDFLTPDRAPGPQASKAAKSNGSADTWDLNFIPSEPAVNLPAVKPSQDIFDIDDFAALSVAQPPHSMEPSSASSPESVALGDCEDDGDDILGSLAKPVAAIKRVPPVPAPQVPSPAPSGPVPSRATSSPPPHVLGQIVEMGFSVQQARIALEATPTGLDVDAALEILLQNADVESDERQRERERQALAEVDRIPNRRRQDPTHDSVFAAGSLPSVPVSQQGLQDQADRLLSQASTIGSSMFNKANAFWKEGRERVAKAYEEQRSGNAGGGAGKERARPRWMVETKAIASGGVVSMDKDDNPKPRESQSLAWRPPPRHQQSEPPASLFADESTVLYKSPARRRPSPSKAPSPSPTLTVVPRSISRPAITASSSAIAESNKHKVMGTEHFKLGRFAEADAAYSGAIAALPASHLLCVPLHNNRALTRLRTGDYKGAVDDAGEVVSIVTADAGAAWHPCWEAGNAGVDLGNALGKALRRRAEAREGLEKWKEAMEDWNRLSTAAWIGRALRGEAVKGAGRCRRMARSESVSTQVQFSKPKPASLPASDGPSEALARVRAANMAQEVEDQARHDLKDIVDARLETWRAGKENNLRALIASLDTVLWPELGWQKVGMAELVSPGQVKVRYGKAIAKLHPDKLNVNNTTLEQRMIANGVFGTLNQAWNAVR